MADIVNEVHCGFFDAINSDRTYSANDMNKPYSRVVADGVFATPYGTPSTDMMVSATGSDMNITIMSGQGIFASRWFENQSAIIVTVPSNASVNPRIDSVIAQVDKTVAGRKGNIVYREGTPSVSPSAPAINTNPSIVEYRIANIYVSAGATAITNANVTDLRGSSECPWVTALIQQVDTSSLWQQYQTAYELQYEQFSEDYDAYVEAQQEAWESFIGSLTQDLDVSMSVIVLASSYTSVATATNIPINIQSYDKTTDGLQVFVNGMLLMPTNDYTISNDSSQITLVHSITAGQTVNFIVFKSLVGASISSATSLISQLDAKVDAFMADSGWSNLTLSNGSAYDASHTPQIRSIGGRIYIRGAIKGVTSAGTTIATMPVNYRPSADHIYTASVINGNNITQTVAIQIASSGAVTLKAISGSIGSSYMIPLNTMFVVG